MGRNRRASTVEALLLICEQLASFSEGHIRHGVNYITTLSFTSPSPLLPPRSRTPRASASSYI